jgi:hypothetical protein
MKTLWVVLLILVITEGSFAAIHRVAKDGTGDFATIQPALDASLAGDTVIVMGDMGPYSGNVSVPRRMTIIGQGYGCSTNPGTQQIGDITFSGASDGSIVEGFYLSAGTIHAQTGDSVLTISRCYVIQNNTMYHCIDMQGTGQHVLIEETILDGASDCLFLNAANSFVTCHNVTFVNCSQGIDSYDLSSIIQLENCCFLAVTTPLVDTGNWSISNTIFWDCAYWSGAVSGYVLTSYNARTGFMTSFPFLAGQDTTILTNPFVGYNDSQDWQRCTSNVNLPSGSGLINRGDPNAAPDRDGSRRDLGIYGGPTPFIDTGAPDFPFVTQYFVPSTVPQNGILEIRSTGRVGQGQ